MTEQEKSDEAPTEGTEPKEENAPEQPQEQEASPGEGAEQRAAAREAAAPAAPAEGPAPAAGEGAERPPREIVPAGPPVAIVAPRRPRGQPIVSRRTILRAGFWSSLGVALAGTAACGLDLVWPRGVTGFGGKISAGDVSQYPPGSKTEIALGRFWLVHLTEEQGGPGLLALWWKCPHLGCTVPWKPTFVWPDPATGADRQGWFRCPCHGSTYTDAGILVFGPAPRSMDTMELVVERGSITVDTGKITPGAPDNPDRAVHI